MEQISNVSTVRISHTPIGKKQFLLVSWTEIWYSKSLYDNFRCELFTGKPQIEEPNGYYVSTTLGITLRLLERYGYEYLKGCNLCKPYWDSDIFI